MTTWRSGCLCVLVLKAAVLYATSVDGADSVFGNDLDPPRDLLEGNRNDSDRAAVSFSLRRPSRPYEDLCYIVPGVADTLTACAFKPASKTFFVIHGWLLNGVLESWVSTMASALFAREPFANVVVVDWLAEAQTHYAVAAWRTRAVGREVARFIDWLEDSTNTPAEKVHLIGYSLGAHVAGFAGSHTANKVGRITGLDPAGPVFEGVHADGRLSPDDARFVDALHTSGRGPLGLSIGIQQPVGHVDVYPNGGSFQPGCNLMGTLEKISKFGIFGVSDTVKCAHERSIHLFIDSLRDGRQAARAYGCGSSERFNRGMCLRCRKSRCSAVGYGAGGVRRARGIQMYTKTRATSPYRVYHYQLKIHFSSKVTSGMKPLLSVSLLGTKGEAENLKLKLRENIVANRTHSFLAVTEAEVGDLLMLKLKWEDTNSWSSSGVWGVVSAWWGGSSDSADVRVRKIRVLAGETQQRSVFCAQDPDVQNLMQEVTFVRCREAWRTSGKRSKVL